MSKKAADPKAPGKRAKPAKKQAAAQSVAKTRQNPTKATVPPPPKPPRLSAKAERFIIEYLVDFNGTKAAQRAGYEHAYSRSQAHELMRDPRVAERIKAAAAKHSAKVEATVEAVMDRLWDVANADSRELSELHRVACRYCYGTDHKYQYRAGELELAKEEWQANWSRKNEGECPIPFDEKGGIGYSIKKEPHPNCTGCDGEGIERVVFKDTRDLSPRATRLFGGVKTTQNGIEVKAKDPEAALQAVGKQLGMFANRIKVGATDNPSEDAELIGLVVMPGKKKAGSDSAT